MVWDFTHLTHIKHLNKLNLLNQFLAINGLLPNHLIPNVLVIYFCTLIHLPNIYGVYKSSCQLGAQKLEKWVFSSLVAFPYFSSKTKGWFLWILEAVWDYDFRPLLDTIPLDADGKEKQIFTPKSEVAGFHIWVISTERQIVWLQMSRHTFI